MRKLVSLSMAAMLAAAATFSAVKTSTAGVFPVDTVTPKAVTSDVVDVRHRGGAVVAGIGLGLLGAAILGSPYYYGPRYNYPYYYPGYYYPPYPYYGAYYRPYYPRYRYYQYRRHW